jgi:Spy/CpxP family protein refolding chaperone
MQVRTIALLTLLMTSGSAGFSQGPQPQEKGAVFYMNHAAMSFPGQPGAPSDEAIQKVRSALNLSEAQVNALKALFAMRQQTIEQTFQSVGETHRKLEDLMQQPNPNPTEVGTAFLATRSIEQRMKAADEKFRTDFRAMLSPDQRATLDKLKTASEQINSLEEAGIIERPFPHDFTMRAFEPGFAIGFPGELSKEH